MELTLSALTEKLAVCKLEPDAAIPAWALAGDFFSVTRTADELSVVCPESLVPPGVRTEGDWRAFKVEGPLDFGLTGIMDSLTGPLANAGISVFAISTFDTDYLLVKAANFERALAVLAGAGFSIK